MPIGLERPVGTTAGEQKASGKEKQQKARRQDLLQSPIYIAVHRSTLFVLPNTLVLH
jgi:hypothetical protein